MKVINLLGGANTGKSTTAFGVLYHMKKMGLRVEYAGEYARDMVLEKRDLILDDQLYMLAKQNRKLHRLRNLELDYVITDTCLLLGIAYAVDPTPELVSVIRTYFGSYDNLTFYLPRVLSFQFQNIGRVQHSHEEAALVDPVIESILPSDTVRLDPTGDFVTQILDYISGD